MNKIQIVDAVMNKNMSLLFVSKGFMEPTDEFFMKAKDDHNLIRVHGKSAKSARKELLNITGVGRSYYKSKIQTGDKKRNVLVSEYLKVSV